MIQEIISKLAGSRILVAGDVMLDSYWHGSTSRISPEAPVPVVQISREERRVGGAGNVALNAATLGATTYLLGLAGQDSAADQLEDLLQRGGVRTVIKRVATNRTITKLRVISRHQQLIRLDFENDISNWGDAILLDEFNSHLRFVDAVVLSDYSKGALQRPNELISAARELGKPVIVDPKGIDYERYRGATLLKPNLSEFEAVVGSCARDSDIEIRGMNLIEALDLEAILVTRSEMGMTLLTRGHPSLHLPTKTQEVFDVTGAGDTVIATLGLALAAGIPLDQAAYLSNIAASIVVAKLGTSTVSPAELANAVEGETHMIPRGICTEGELLNRIEKARTHGECIVMTNGCFDILHPGHIDYLEKARTLGDRLVVAVNDDDSVRRLKGQARPINPLNARMRMLSALACVDWVISFSEDTPERLYCKVLPDILVKGGDYSEDQIAGAACVKTAGGSVQILDFSPGHSTTALINRIQKA